MSSKKRIGLIGCGTIGTEVALAVLGKFSHSATLEVVCEVDPQHKKNFDQATGKNIPNVGLLECVEQSDLIVEAAHADVVPHLLRQACLLRRDVLILSVGGLFQEEGLIEQIEGRGIRVYLPSGAIGGVDLLKSASIGKIYTVTLKTRKPIEALRGAPFIEQSNIDLDSILGEKTIFEGKASEAIKAFPQNVNVAATLSLAGIGLEKTRVTLITSRSFKKNTHEIFIEGEFGKATFLIENEPSPKNPKTSSLASFSAIQTLNQILSGIQIGT